MIANDKMPIQAKIGALRSGRQYLSSKQTAANILLL
jgi:hypothetical protein